MDSSEHVEGFSAWKGQLARDRNVVETSEAEPLEQVLEKMVSFSELMQQVEDGSPILVRTARPDVTLADLDRWITGCP